MSRDYRHQSWFNEAAGEKAYQRQAREQAAERYEGNEWWPENPDLSSARVRETDRSVAAKIIREYEWLGTIPPSTKYYGLFFRGEDEDVDPWACGGVTCWTDTAGAGSNVVDMYGVEPDELAYLHRGANVHWAPPNSNSKLIAYSLDYEKERGKKVAVAYSDRDAGEIGTVYQATGWYCLGPGSSIKLYLHPETGVPYNQRRIGQLLDSNNLREKGWTWTDMRDYMLEQGWEPVRTTPKYRYIKILAEGDEKRRIYERIKEHIVGYPKRERDAYPDGVVDGDRDELDVPDE